MIAAPMELHRLKTNLPPWLKAIVLLASELGLRFTEATEATVGNWSAERNELTIRAKGNKYRTLPVGEELAQLINLAAQHQDTTTPIIWLLHGEPVRVGPTKGGLRRDDSFIRKAWWRWKKKLAINPQLSFHDLRRTRITEVYRATLDLRATQQFAGHESLLSTALYIAPWDAENMRRILQGLTPPGGWKGSKVQ